MTIDFFVDGKPAPQGSKRHVGGGRMIEASKALKPWRHHIAETAAKHLAGAEHWLPVTGEPVSIELWFVMPRPVRTKITVPHIKRPDVDKLARAVLDGLTGVLFDDDSAVVHLLARKRMAEPDETTGVHIRVTTAGTTA